MKQYLDFNLGQMEKVSFKGLMEAKKTGKGMDWGELAKWLTQHPEKLGEMYQVVEENELLRRQLVDMHKRVEENELLKRQLKGERDSIEKMKKKLKERVDRMEQLSIRMGVYSERLKNQSDVLNRRAMMLNEREKLMMVLTKKASEEALIETIRFFVNKSKHKKDDKKTFVKSMIYEITSAKGIELPEDLSAAVEHLDDEEVNVARDYYDVHDNKEVKIK